MILMTKALSLANKAKEECDHVMTPACYGDAEKVTKSSQFSFISSLFIAKVDRVC